MFVLAFLDTPVGKTEVSHHTFWDSFIRIPLAVLFDRLHGSTERNSHKPASTGTKRPDLTFTFKEVCVFRGEEEAPGVSEDIPKRELSGKLVWSYGEAPYVLGYTAVGYECTLFAIYSTDQKTVKTEPFAVYDSARLSERFRFVLALIHLGRLFPELVRLCPYTAKAEFVDIPRANKVVVHLNPTFVVKDFTNARNVDHTPMSTQQVEALEIKYKQLEQLGVPDMERLTKTSKCGRKFTFEPRGFEVLPKSLRELAVALRCVLGTLVHLHRQGWMHRDIRWPNVLRTRDAEPRWFLIDLTDAARSPQKFPDGSHLNKDEHAPEIFVEGGQHTTAVDMWSVGYLIQKSTWNDSWKANKQRRAFLKSLLEEDPTKRPTAPQALEKLEKLMHAIPKDEGNQA
jgi:hypothetical protein